MMFYTGCVLAVLVLGGPTVESLTDERTCVLYAEKGNCTFYTDCLEARYDCKSEGYPVGYGYRYCNKFQTHYSRFNAEGKTWINDTRRCLTKALLPAYKSQSYDCKKLKEFAFDSHPECYTKNGFCQIILSLTNMQALLDVFELDDFLGEDRDLSLEQVLMTARQCLCAYGYGDVSEVAAEAVENTRDLQMVVENIWTKILDDTTEENPKEEIKAECAAKALQGDCDFYTDCLERRHPCGRKGFASQEGHPLCQRLQEKKGLFQPKGQLWVMDFTRCLTRSLLPKYRNASTSCRHINNFGYRALHSCLIDTGICDLLDDRENEGALWLAYDDWRFRLELSTILCRCHKYEGGHRYKRVYSNALGGWKKQKASVVDQTSPADEPCTNQGGKCQDYTVRTCLAGYESCKCGNYAIRRCCLPCDSSCEANHERWSAGDSGCSDAGGQCKMDSNICYGQYKGGLCGGPSGRKCCVPGSSGLSGIGSADCTVHPYCNARFVGKPIHVDDSFRDSMDKINKAAEDCNVMVDITSSWRKDGQVITGGIYPEATRSNHLIGHAIDMNIFRPDGTRCNSVCLKAQSDSYAICFIGKVRATGLRWGGVWTTDNAHDPVHIDDGHNWNIGFPAYDLLVVKLQRACQHIPTV